MKWIWLLMMVGCIGRKEYTNIGGYREGKEVEVRIDERFSKEEEEEIGGVIGEWNYVLNGRVRYRIIGERFNMGEREMRAEGIVIMRVEGNEMGEGVMGWEVRKKYISIDMRYGRLGGILKHELGHVLGLGHIEGGIMSKYYTEGCIGEEVKEGLKGLGIEGVNYCR